MTDVIHVPSEEEIRQVPPRGTKAIVKVRTGEDGLPMVKRDEWRDREGKPHPYVLPQFVVEGGEWNNKYASMFIPLDGTDRTFRAAFKAIIGQDLSAASDVSTDKFLTELTSNRFEAEIGPGTEKDPVTGKRVESTRYTAVLSLIRKVGEGATVEEEEFDGPIGADDDIPF